MPLTDTKCKNAKPTDKQYRIPDGRGLNLEVRPKGGKYWRMRYRYLGTAKMLALGVYPEVSLAEARDKCTEARKLLEQNIDPMLQKKKKKLLARESADNSFEVISREWHENIKHRWTERHAITVLRRLENDIFPEIGGLPIEDITPPILLAALKKIEARAAYEPAHRMKQTSGQIFRYAIARGISMNNPAASIGEALKPLVKKHYPALDASELPELLSALEANNARLRLETRLAIKLLMFTFVRTKELIEAKWEEFDLKNAVWTVPAERMKMRNEHIVPLSRQALEILQQLKLMHGHREWILPGHHSPIKHMSNNTILQGLRRMGFQGRMTGHGFRALAMSTIKEKLGYRHEVIDRQLAHAAKSMVVRAYDRAQFLDERTKMVQEWADYIDSITVNGKVISAKFG